MGKERIIKTCVRFDLSREEHRHAYECVKRYQGRYRSMNEYMVAAVLAFDGTAGGEISDENCRKIARFLKQELQEEPLRKAKDTPSYGV